MCLHRERQFLQTISNVGAYTTEQQLLQTISNVGAYTTEQQQLLPTTPKSLIRTPQRTAIYFSTRKFRAASVQDRTLLASMRLPTTGSGSSSISHVAPLYRNTSTSSTNYRSRVCTEYVQWRPANTFMLTAARFTSCKNRTTSFCYPVQQHFMLIMFDPINTPLRQ